MNDEEISTQGELWKYQIDVVLLMLVLLDLGSFGGQKVVFWADFSFPETKLGHI